MVLPNVKVPLLPLQTGEAPVMVPVEVMVMVWVAVLGVQPAAVAVMVAVPENTGEKVTSPVVALITACELVVLIL
ncbi:hypothetical protein D3C87_715850 [compost metagenome]